MKTFFRTIYWMSLWSMIIVLGMLVLFEVADAGGAQNLIRDLPWPTHSEVSCE